MMDDYLDHLIYPPTWVDGDGNERSSWSAGELGQPNVLLPTSLRLYEDDTRNSPGSVIGSSQHVECLAAQDTSSFVLCNEQGYDAEKGFIFPEAALKKDDQNCNGHSSPNGVMNGSLKAENVELQYAGSLLTTSSMNFCYSKQLPIDGCLMPSLSCTETSSVGCKGSEESEHLKSLINMQNLSSMQQFWPSLSYNGVSSLLPSMGLDSVQGSGMQEGQLNNGLEVVAKNYVNVDEFHHVDKEFAFTPKGNQDVQSCSLPSFAAEPNVTVAANQLPYLPQTTSSALTRGCNRNGKTRVRARRGQATDPHSIAERLRREKIVERMRNLQELVPNSSKVDKASMLDEIIDYVKFLQLQVKVLSMSRLGAAGAVIPLITDGQPEGNNTLSLSASAGMGLDPSPSPDQVAFEQEVLKLMESNVTLAMHYLQSKGLCLMPIALASAISSGKASLPGTGPNERKKFSPTNGFAHDNSSNSSNSSCGLLGIETHQYNFNMVTGRRSSDGIMASGSNGDVTEEQAKNA